MWTNLKGLVVFRHDVLKIILIALPKIILSNRLNSLLVGHVPPGAERPLSGALVRLQIRNAQVEFYGVDWMLHGTHGPLSTLIEPGAY